jgi:hypothetical protein
MVRLWSLKQRRGVNQSRAETHHSDRKLYAFNHTLALSLNFRHIACNVSSKFQQ